MIRKATIADLDGLALLFDKYRIFYERESDLDGAKSFLSERIYQNDSEIFVAEDADGKLIGFVQLYPLFSSTRMKRLWLLNDLFVEQFHRGKGFSKSLINKAKELAKTTGAAGLTLETAKSNEIGNQLYPNAGFTLDLDHNFYYWDVK